MAAPPDPVDLLELGSGLALLAAGGIVAWRAPRERAALGAAGFLAGFGALTVVGSAGASPFDPAGLPLYVAAQALTLLAGLALLVFLAGFPRPLDAAERRGAWLAVGLVVANIAATWVLLLPVLAASFAVLSLVAAAPFLGGLLLASLVLPLRYLGPGGAEHAPAQRATAWMAAAMLAFPCVLFGGAFVNVLRGGNTISTITIGFDVATLALAAALWLRNTLEATLEESRTSRDLALLVFGLLAVGVLAARLSSLAGSPLPTAAALAAARVATAALAAHALLRVAPGRQA